MYVVSEGFRLRQLYALSFDLHGGGESGLPYVSAYAARVWRLWTSNEAEKDTEMSLVFIPQEPMIRVAGRWVSKGLDIASANAYGDIVFVWPPGTSVMSRGLVEGDAERAAERYDERVDYVVALGSPSLIAALGWAIGRKGKTLRMLEWDKALKRYYPTLGETLTKGE